MARYIVQKAEGVGGDPIPADEPCLVIRAQDHLAPFVMQFYIDEYEKRAGQATVPGAGPGAGPDQAVIAELREHLERLLDWQEANADKVKWADR